MEDATAIFDCRRWETARKLEMIEGSLQVRLRTIWTDGKAEVHEKSQRGNRKKREDQRRERVRRKKMKAREKVAKSRSVLFFNVFQMFCGSGESRSRLAKAAGAEPSGQMRDETWIKLHVAVACCGAKQMRKSKCQKKRNDMQRRKMSEVEMWNRCTPLWREADLEVKRCKAHHSRSTFRSWDLEKMHAVAAQSTCLSQKIEDTTCSHHFWTLKCRFLRQIQRILHPAL